MHEHDNEPFMEGNYLRCIDRSEFPRLNCL